MWDTLRDIWTSPNANPFMREISNEAKLANSIFANPEKVDTSNITAPIFPVTQTV